MEKRLIARGLLAGAVAAVLAFVFARLCAEPTIGRAIAYEDGRIEAENAQGVHEHGIELFTRGVQANAGLGFGVLLFGVAMGALFAVAFCVVYARAKSHAPRSLSVQLAAAAFIAIYLVPFVKYPPNPPAVGQSDTIGERTGWYLAMVLISMVLAVAAVWLALRIQAGFAGYPVGAVGDHRRGLRDAGRSSAGRAGRERTGLEHRDVTDVLRLTLVSHAMTDAMAAPRFPADEPLNLAR